MKLLVCMFFCGVIAAGCDKEASNAVVADPVQIVYFETNDASQNAVLAYSHQPDGTLTPLPGSPFMTGGKGIANPTQALGPDDSDNQLRITPDGKYLLAVNPGSRTIAVFSIASNGALTPVAGSPFNSEGPTPVSIAIKGQYVYVVNKGVSDASASGNEPNYTVMTIDANGKLASVPGSAVKTASGSSPTQALLSTDGKFLFGADFLGFMLTPAQGSLRSFTINADGLLAPVAGTPAIIPGKGGALGLWQHPSANILYVGFPLQSKVGVYAIDATSGALSLTKTVDAGPAVCWLRTSGDGKYLYTLNSGENSISVFNTQDAVSPMSIGKLILKNPGPDYTAMDMTFTTSQDFSFELSTDGKYCYVISQHTNKDFSIGNYNFLHVLTVQPDGMLLEPGEPLNIPVDASVRPQGVVTFEASK